MKRHKRIELKKLSLLKFEQYLMNVREQCPEEFPEINDILDRYYTLEGKKKELTQQNRKKEQMFEELKENITKYQKEGEAKKIDLTNQVQILMNKKEKITAQKNKINESVQNHAKNAREKMSKFAQVLMAINNLDNKCQDYGGDDEHGKKKSTLRFNLNMEGFNAKPKQFDISEGRVKFAIRQLQGIKIFVEDLNEIKKSLDDPVKYPNLASTFQQLKANPGKHI